jgi:DNA-binding PadR family transcriptional regulator
LPLTHIVYHVLLSLSQGEKHGYGIIKDVASRTRGALEIEAGTLYAAVRRMTEDGLIQGVAAPPGTDARRRYYSVTPLGRQVLRAESLRLEAMVELARDAHVLGPSTRAKA